MEGGYLGRGHAVERHAPGGVHHKHDQRASLPGQLFAAGTHRLGLGLGSGLGSLFNIRACAGNGWQTHIADQGWKPDMVVSS